MSSWAQKEKKYPKNFLKQFNKVYSREARDKKSI